MAARTGMTDIIQAVRDFAVAGTADYTLNATGYWSDEQIQTVLDRNKLSVVREKLEPTLAYNSGGTVEYLEYRSAYGNYEETTGGTTIFEIESAAGTTVGTANWTMDYAGGILTFDEDTSGSAYFINGSSYDIHMAASEIWRMKAGHHSGAVDFSTDNMTVKRSQMIQNDRDMAVYYAGMGRIKTIQTERGDTY